LVEAAVTARAVVTAGPVTRQAVLIVVEVVPGQVHQHR